MLCLLCVVPLVCLSWSSFDPPSSLFLFVFAPPPLFLSFIYFFSLFPRFLLVIFLSFSFFISRPPGLCSFFWLLYADDQTILVSVLVSATQLANQQEVRSNKVARKRLTESNGTLEMDPGPMKIDPRVHSHIVLKYTFAYADMYVSFIGLRLTKTSLTLINRTRLRTKGQSAGYPQAQIEITSNSFQRRAP